ncbi:MAG: hypothetical protein H7832_13225 [Magnetococcus sp. DMHC-6]
MPSTVETIQVTPTQTRNLATATPDMPPKLPSRTRRAIRMTPPTEDSSLLSKENPLSSTEQTVTIPPSPQKPIPPLSTEPECLPQTTLANQPKQRPTAQGNLTLYQKSPSTLDFQTVPVENLGIGTMNALTDLIEFMVYKGQHFLSLIHKNKIK